jgi:hypothetical protein
MHRVHDWFEMRMQNKVADDITGEPLAASPGAALLGQRKGPKQAPSPPPLLAARRAAPGPRPDIDDGVIEAWGAASSVPSSALGNMAAPAVIPLAIEREMWMSFAAVRQRRALRFAKIGLAAVRTRHTPRMAFTILLPAFISFPDVLSLSLGSGTWPA